MIIKAAVAYGPTQRLVIESLTLDEPRADELLVRLVASGVSLADRDAIAGGSAIPFPFVGGGEGAGIVERVGAEVEGFAAGDTVILSLASCGRCAECAAGEPGLCVQRPALNDSGRRDDGSVPLFAGERPVHGFFSGQSSFATHAVCRPSSAVRVPVDAPLEVLACLGGEVSVAAAALMRGLCPQPEDTIVIAGAGCCGLAAVMSAHALGVGSIIVTEPDAARRELATTLGATLTVHTDDDLAAVVMSMTGRGARYALDTTGEPAAIAACLASLGAGGVCGCLRPASGQIATSAERHVRDVGHGCGSRHEIIAQLVAWHAAGRFPIERLIAYFPFEHINDALDALETGAVIKPIVRFVIGPFAALDRAGMAGAAIDEPVTNEPVTNDGEPAEDTEPAVTVAPAV